MKRYKYDCCRIDGDLKEFDFEILDAAGFVGWQLLFIREVNGECFAVFQKEYEGEYNMDGLPKGFREWAEQTGEPPGHKRPKELDGFNWMC